MINDIKHYLKKYIILILLFCILIVLMVFKRLFIQYQYIAEWLALISLIGVFMQLQWRHQDMHRRYLTEKRNHRILWTLKLHTGIFSGIINNSINWSLIHVKNLSGKYVYNIEMKFMIFNVNEITSNGIVSVNPNGKSHKCHKGNTTIVTVPGPWSYIHKFILNNTYGDNESITPVLSNKFLFRLFHKYFTPGKYTFTLLFLCLRNSHREELHVTYKYCSNIYKCQVLKLFKIKNK